MDAKAQPGEVRDMGDRRLGQRISLDGGELCGWTPRKGDFDFQSHFSITDDAQRLLCECHS